MILRVLLVVLMAWAPVAARAAGDLDPLRPAMEKAIARVQPALVRIQVVWVDYVQGREVKNQASGSGFIIKKKGYVVTNHHVAGRATRAICIFANNEEIEATLVGTDPMTDIAVLKLDDSKHKEFPTVDWGDSDAVAVGDTVLAMGSPLSLSQSVTRGIVSNAKMVMPAMIRRWGGFALEGEDVGALVRWIAHDAPIYPGNSGGPLVNLRGEVIGVNEISLGLGGAIPSNLARDVAEQIIANGLVTRAWIGAVVQPLLKTSGLTSGALIGSVLPDGPAAQAGLQPSDILVRLNGEPVSVRFDEEIPLLNQRIASLTPGQKASVVVLREGREVPLEITLAEREPTIFRQQELKAWGLTCKNISLLMMRELKLDSRDGVFVTTVRPGGPCGEAKPSIQSGDILTAVAGQPVRNVSDLIERTAAITANQKKPVPTVVEFRRRTERFLTVVRVGIRDLEDPGAEARKAWLPVAVQVLTREMAEHLGLPGRTGVRITRVHPNTTAAAAGLQVGDLILAIDGESIPASQPGDEEIFTNRIRQYRVGDRPEFTLRRGDTEQKLAVELERSPKLEREMARMQDNNFEFSARDLSFFDRVRDNLADDVTGALVTEVKEGGWAALGEMRLNDIIQFVDNQPIADVAALEARMKEIAAARPKYVVFRVLRGIHTRYLEFQPNWDNEK